MRLSRASIALLFSLGLILLFAACGGSNNKPENATTITISSNNISLKKGEVLQLSPTATNSAGTTIAADFIYSTADPTLVNVSSTGLACAGTWDAATAVCKPTTKTGTTTITISAKNSTATLPVTAFVHEQVDSIQIVPPSDCVSSTKTLQLQAKAYSNSDSVCAGLGASAPCALPTNSIGDFTWHSADTGVVTVDNATNPTGLATAQTSGTAKVYASLGTTNSPNATFTTCPVVSVQITRQDTNDTTPFSLDVSTSSSSTTNTKTLKAVVVDSKGVTLSAANLSWYSTNSYSLSVSGSTDLTATVTASRAASTAAVTASCATPNCNKNLTPIWAGAIVGSVNGTTPGSVVYVASTNSTTVYPVDGTTLGTAITLPRAPNSFLMNQQGTSSIMGSDAGGLMFLDPSSNAVASLSGVTNAKALAISQNGTLGVAANSTDLFILDMTGKLLLDLKLGGITSAAFVPGTNLLLASKGNDVVYQIDTSNGIYSPYSATANVNGIAAVNNGPVVYLAQPGKINVLASCDPSQSIDTQTATNPSSVTSLPTAQGAVALDLPNLVVVNSSNINQACPPAISNTRLSFDLGLGSPSTTYLVVTPDSSKAVITTNTAKLAIADVKNGQSNTVTLGGGATAAYEGGITADSANFYVGASDGTLHRIDLSAKSDAQQITVGLKQSDGSTMAIPDLVQVKNK